MFCVIQKVVNKKPNEYGARKELFVDTYNFTVGDKPVKYTYKYSEERFARPVLDAYKISIHKSYRDKRKVKKKQWVICTMTYYHLLEFGPWDCIHSKKLNDKLEEIGITEEDLWDMVCEKLDPIVETVKKEFESTEEYKTQIKHDAILKNYREDKHIFEQKYGADTYDYCYDIFGHLRNPEYLKQLELQYQAQQEYKERSYRAYEQSNYNSYQSSSYYGIKQSNYTDEDKSRLKQIYKALSLKFHPDVTKDDGEMMKFINRLKDEWGI